VVSAEGGSRKADGGCTPTTRCQAMTANTTTRVRAHKDDEQLQPTIQFDARNTLSGQYNNCTIYQFEGYDEC